MEEKIITTTDSFKNVKAREIDFVERFNRNWDALRQIMSISRPIRKQNGTELRKLKTTVTLEDGEVAEGDEIPYSKAEIEQVGSEKIKVKKWAKGVTIEDVIEYGADIAIQRTDDEFLYELQNVVMKDYFTTLNAGELEFTETSWKRALAMARGNVLNKFAKMHRTVTEVVGFANILDLYDYLGDVDVTIQTQFGLSYVQNFLGYRTLFLLSDEEIARNKVIATPVENINLYYVDPDSEFARLGLNYTAQGETNLLGFHAEGNYSHAVGESYAILGMKLWSEYVDGIAVGTVGSTATEPTTEPTEPTTTPTEPEEQGGEG